MSSITLCAILLLLTWVIHSHTYRHHSKSLCWTYSPLLYENAHLPWHHSPAFSQNGKRVARVVLLQNKWTRVESREGSAADKTLSVFCFSLWTLLAGLGFRAGTKPHRCSCHYQTGHILPVCLCMCVSVFVWKRRWPGVSLISAGRSVAHTAPPIPAPVHLSCRCFLSGWAKTFYLNLLRVPLKGLCYCSEPSCVCVTWESSAGWPSPNTLVHPHTHTHQVLFRRNWRWKSWAMPFWDVCVLVTSMLHRPLCMYI